MAIGNFSSIIWERQDSTLGVPTQDSWRDNFQKSKAVKIAITEVLNKNGIMDETEVHRIFDLVKNQSDY